MKKYKKDGEFYSGSIIVDGRVIFNPSKETLSNAGYEEYVEPEVEETLEDAKRDKIAQIESYDRSNNINTFTLNGHEMWLSKSDRVGLANSLQIEEAAGRTETTLWTKGDNPVSVTMTIVKAKEMLSSLELYALDCYNTTQSHKRNVNKLTVIADVKSYDYTVGYPAALSFNT